MAVRVPGNYGPGARARAYEAHLAALPNPNGIGTGSLLHRAADLCGMGSLWDEIFEGLLDRAGSTPTTLVQVFRATKAGALYAIVALAIGLILGAIRVLLLALAWVETLAVIVEAPMILAASWFVCRWCVDRLSVRRTVPARFLMGLVAFLGLMSAEVGLGVALGRSLGNQLAAFKLSPGAIGLGAQVIFAMFPVIQGWRR